jgi:AcrR family transcriptional regulator
MIVIVTEQSVIGDMRLVCSGRSKGQIAMKISSENQLGRRQSILAAAEKVFGDCGYAATTMEAVADKAGISKGSIYNYFKNKHDLFKSLFTGAFQIVQDESLAVL